jgi:hypothetical protein
VAVDAQDGHAFIVAGAERLEAQAQLIFDHRVTVRAPGTPRTVPVRWKADATAALTTPDGALDVAIKLARSDVGTITLDIEGQWRRATWVHLAALELILPAEHVTLLGRDLVPTAAPPLAYLERFDPKWIAVSGKRGSYTLLVDDDVDGVVVRVQPGKVVVRVELESTEARPFLHDAQCKIDWRAPNAHLGLPARLRLVDEPVHTRLQWVPGTPTMLSKAHFPDGRHAALVVTDHADQTSLPTLRALAHGRSDAPDTPLTMGLVGHHIAITKALFAHGSDRPQLEDPAVVAIADELHRAGSEIVPHSATPRRDERTVTAAALDKFERWGARTWIDHQPETNCEAFGDEGYHSSGRFGIADLLAAHNYEYVWGEVDLEPGPLNLLRPDRLGLRAPTVWPVGRLDAGGPSSLWMFRTQWAFLEAKHFYNMYSAAALDRLERERGIHLAHTYLETYHPRHTKFGLKNLLVPVDPRAQPGGAGPVMLAPEFERLLAALAARQERGTLWIPTLALLADRLRAVAAVKITLASDGRVRIESAEQLAGATFVVARPNAHVLINGAVPAGQRQELGASVVWLDLPAGESVMTIE